VNDNPPKFSGLFSTGIPENAPIGQSVIRITCTDQDIQPNNIITYSINSNEFEIGRSSGEITVKHHLDRELKDSYTLRVYANDGSFQAETDVVIDILDVNDNAPSFTQGSYTFSLVEQEPSGTYIGNIHATDRDISGPNSVVYYRLGEASEFFKVDAQTGNVTSRMVFTYRNVTFVGFSENIYHINILAIDQGDSPLQNKVPVTIEIKPANKHPPQFDQPEYSVPVAEDAVIGQTIFQLNARLVMLMKCFGNKLKNMGKSDIFRISHYKKSVFCYFSVIWTLVLMLKLNTTSWMVMELLISA